MQTTLTVRVPYPPDADAGDGVQVFTDFGSGTIDLTRPLLAAAATLFSGREKRSAGFGSRPLDRGMFATQKSAPRRRATIAQTILATTAFGSTPDFLEIDVAIPAAVGVWKFAAQVVDEQGNVQASALVSTSIMVSSTTPTEPDAIRFNAFDKTSNKITFDLMIPTE